MRERRAKFAGTKGSINSRRAKFAEPSARLRKMASHRSLTSCRLSCSLPPLAGLRRRRKTYRASCLPHGCYSAAFQPLSSPRYQISIFRSSSRLAPTYCFDQDVRMELRALAYPSGLTHFSGLDFFQICRKASPCRGMVPGTYRLPDTPETQVGVKCQSSCSSNACQTHPHVYL